MVGCFVSADQKAALFNCSFMSDVRTSLKQNTETVLGLFQRIQPHLFTR